MTLPSYDCCGFCAALAERGALFCAQCGAALHEDPRLGSFVLGRYLLLERLGAGGMGSVYRAEQRVGRFTRSVAVKILHPELSANRAVRSRFEQECEVVVSLTHANTIRFFDFGELEDGALAIVMEHIEGETLAARLDRGPLPVHEALDVTAQIVGSLTEAHTRGIVHRDLKPENVMLYPRPGRSPGVKVLDFGVAKREVAPGERALTSHGELLGTPAYMSPEQIRGDALDKRSDVYSLGLLVYEMLAGESPFGVTVSLAEWVERHLYERPLSIDAHPAGEALPWPARAALMSALEKRPDDRPPSARALLRALAGRTVERVSRQAPARSDDPPRRVVDDVAPAVPRTRRHVAALALAAAVLAGFLAASSTLLRRSDDVAASPPEAAGEPASLVLACLPTADEPECETL